jgi:malate synthase
MPVKKLNKLNIARPLYDFINDEVLPGLELDTVDFWNSLEDILQHFSAQNEQLLQQRDVLQQQIDQWHQQHEYDENDLAEYKQFLKQIGYLEEESEDFSIAVDNVDAEISRIAGPQLVVPINNARFAINAANARWGSLFDALYGSDMIETGGELALDEGFNENRARQVFEFCNDWLDQVLPLCDAKHAKAIGYHLVEQSGKQVVEVELSDHSRTGLKEPSRFVGSSKDNGTQVLLFENHHLHFELQINAQHKIGKLHTAGICDVVLEAALSTIQDCEDSVAAVDVEDKILVYRNWLELMQGSLSVEINKAGRQFTRKLNSDRQYQDRQGKPFTLPGRSLMFIRNTGLHMMTELVLDENKQRMPEGLIDALVTVLIAMHDFKPDGDVKNSRTGSVYIVKPKMHGAQEVAFSVAVFSAIEQAFGLAPNTIKIGVMDEERRTSVNLKQCIRAARERIVFINTGFLDRTGDEIHTSMQAGAMLPKDDIKKARWISAYENNNVDVALQCGFSGKAQIGKGMWAEPDNLRAMYQSKQAHPEAGASCAWVPSPTAAVIHALHYHRIDVASRQQELKNRKSAKVDEILHIPLLPKKFDLDETSVQQELDNNVQGILGYVVKWIELGIGCSKVPDIHNTGLMEDRATLRISSQLLANWLYHDIISEPQLVQSFQRMAQIVDRQNLQTPGYRPLAPEFNSAAFNAAMELVLKGAEFPNGYTEDCLQRYRLMEKQQ